MGGMHNPYISVAFGQSIMLEEANLKLEIVHLVEKRKENQSIVMVIFLHLYSPS